MQLRGQSTVHAQNSVINQRCNGHVVEQSYEGAPQFEAIAALALVKEAEDPRNLLALMVAAKQENVLWVLYFVREKQTNRLDALFASIDIVAQK